MNEIENAQIASSENAIPNESNIEANPPESAEDTSLSTQEAEPYMSFNYNHNKVELGRDEATEWAQKGMHYFNKLDFLAHIGNTTVDEMLKEMINDVDRQKRLEYEEKFGDDCALVDDLMTLFHQQNKERYQKAQIERAQSEQTRYQNEDERINAEFLKLQEDFPELESISDIPADVVSASRQMPLLVAFMLYRHREEQKIKNAKREAIAAAETTAGSQESTVHDSETTAHNAFMKALWR